MVSATTSGGESYHNIVDFKQFLASRKDELGVYLTRKLLKLITGREIRVLDQPEIKQSTKKAKFVGDSFHDLVLLVVESELFVTRLCVTLVEQPR